MALRGLLRWPCEASSQHAPCDRPPLLRRDARPARSRRVRSPMEEKSGSRISLNLVLVLTREHYLTLIFHILGRIARLLSGERLLYLRIPDYSGHNYICQYPINGRTVSSVQCKSTLPTNNALNAVLGSVCVCVCVFLCVCVCVCVCCASTHMRTLRLNPSTLNPNL